MKINEEYSLTSDSLNWILQKRFEKKKKEGEEDKNLFNGYIYEILVRGEKNYE